MVRKLYILGGGLVLLFCMSSIAHSLLVQQVYCPICEHHMSEVRSIGNPRTDNHATFFKCSKCGTGLVR